MKLLYIVQKLLIFLGGIFFSNSKPLEVKKDKLKDELIKIKEHIQSLIHIH